MEYYCILLNITIICVKKGIIFLVVLYKSPNFATLMGKLCLNKPNLFNNKRLHLRVGKPY